MRKMANRKPITPPAITAEAETERGGNRQYSESQGLPVYVKTDFKLILVTGLATVATHFSIEATLRRIIKIEA